MEEITHSEAKGRAESAYWAVYSPALEAYHKGNKGSFEDSCLGTRHLREAVALAMEAYWQAYRDAISEKCLNHTRRECAGCQWLKTSVQQVKS